MAAEAIFCVPRDSVLVNPVVQSCVVQKDKYFIFRLLKSRKKNNVSAFQCIF